MQARRGLTPGSGRFQDMKATLTALFGGAAIAVMVAGALVFVIKYQNKPLVDNSIITEQNQKAQE